MGYTHYWYTKPDLNREKWHQFTKDVEAIFDLAQVTLAGGNGDYQTEPIVDSNVVSFNGLEDESYETCYIERIPSGKPISGRGDEDGFVFECCKTACKPYDEVVTAVLLALKYRFGEDVILHSDGDEGEWLDGQLLCSQALQTKVPLPNTLRPASKE